MAPVVAHEEKVGIKKPACGVNVLETFNQGPPVVHVVHSVGFVWCSSRMMKKYLSSLSLCRHGRGCRVFVDHCPIPVCCAPPDMKRVKLAPAQNAREAARHLSISCAPLDGKGARHLSDASHKVVGPNPGTLSKMNKRFDQAALRTAANVARHGVAVFGHCINYAHGVEEMPKLLVCISIVKRSFV